MLRRTCVICFRLVSCRRLLAKTKKRKQKRQPHLFPSLPLFLFQNPSVSTPRPSPPTTPPSRPPPPRPPPRSPTSASPARDASCSCRPSSRRHAPSATRPWSPTRGTSPRWPGAPGPTRGSGCLRPRWATCRRPCEAPLPARPRAPRSCASRNRGSRTSCRASGPQARSAAPPPPPPPRPSRAASAGRGSPAPPPLTGAGAARARRRRSSSSSSAARSSRRWRRRARRSSSRPGPRSGTLRRT